jgi:hypothetical protein
MAAPPPADSSWTAAVRDVARGVRQLGDVAVLIAILYGLIELATPYPAARWPLQTVWTWLLYQAGAHVVRGVRKRNAEKAAP